MLLNVFFDLCGRYGRLYGVAPLPMLVDLLGPNHKTIKSTVAVTEANQRNNVYGSVEPPFKIGEQSL